MNKSIDLAVNNLQRFKFLTIRVRKKTRLARFVQFRDDFIFNEHVGSLSVFHVCLLFHLAEVYVLVVHRYIDDIPLNQDKRGASRCRDYNEIALPDNSCSTIDRLTLTIGRLRSRFLDVLIAERSARKSSLPAAPSISASPNVLISIRGDWISLTRHRY